MSKCSLVLRYNIDGYMDDDEEYEALLQLIKDLDSTAVSVHIERHERIDDCDE